MSILLYGCTTWTLTKIMEKKLDGNHIRMLRSILNKSWRQHPTMQQLYGHLPRITKTIQIRRTRHVGHCWRSGDELISAYSCGPLHMDEQRLEDQLEPIFFIIQRVKARAIPCPHQPPTRGDNTVSVAQGGTANPGATKQLLPLEENYIYIRQIN